MSRPRVDTPWAKFHVNRAPASGRPPVFHVERARLRRAPRCCSCSRMDVWKSGACCWAASVAFHV